MSLYKRVQNLVDEHEEMLLHFKHLNKVLCQLVVDLLGEGLTKPESYMEFQRLMIQGKEVQ